MKLTKNVLQNLSDIVRWASRYPIPVNFSKVFQMNKVYLMYAYMDSIY